MADPGKGNGYEASIGGGEQRSLEVMASRAPFGNVQAWPNGEGLAGADGGMKRPIISRIMCSLSSWSYKTAAVAVDVG